MRTVMYSLWRRFACTDASGGFQFAAQSAQNEVENTARCAAFRVSASRTRSSKGFTLVETLLALAILVLLTGVVAAGVPVAWKTYTKAVDAANAEVALTTTSALLRDELGLAQDVFYNTETGKVIYYKTGDCYWASIEKPSSNGEGLSKQAYIGPMPVGSSGAAANYGLSKSGDPAQLMPKAMLTNNLKVTYDDIVYSDGLFTVKGLKVLVAEADGTDSTLAETGKTTKDLIIRAALL